MKKMFVAFGIAIAVFCGMILVPNEEAQAAEIYSAEEISTAFKQALEDELANYSEVYDERGITDVTVDHVIVIELPEDKFAIGVFCSACYDGAVITDVQSTIASAAEISEFMELFG